MQQKIGTERTPDVSRMGIQAVVCQSLGAPLDPGSSLRLTVQQVPQPNVGPGDVKLAVKACGVNFADVLQLQGRYQEKPNLPFIPGSEVRATGRRACIT